MLLAPSVLAADPANLVQAARLAEAGGADLLHFDVMDGHFVPNLTFGVPVLEALVRETELPVDVHLMVSNPERLLDRYLAAGAAWVSVHWEACTHLDRQLHRIRGAGAKAGVALNPATPVGVLEDVLSELDFVLLMSVNPGFSGQSLLPYVLDKARRLRRRVDGSKMDVRIEMDGGIGPENVGEVLAAGVDVCVAGSSIYGVEDPLKAMAALRAGA